MFEVTTTIALTLAIRRWRHCWTAAAIIALSSTTHLVNSRRRRFSNCVDTGHRLSPQTHYAPDAIAEALSDDARLTSVAYIGPKSRTERPRKTKIGTEVATSHATRTPLSRSKGQMSACRGRRHIVAASRTACFRKIGLTVFVVKFEFLPTLTGNYINFAVILQGGVRRPICRIWWKFVHTFQSYIDIGLLYVGICSRSQADGNITHQLK